MKKNKKKKSVLIAAVIFLLLVSAPFIINAYVKASMAQYLISEDAASKVGADCILVLGAGLKVDGTPSEMLKDRLDEGIALYKEGAAQKLLLSGDNSKIQHNEVNAMKLYVQAEGVPPEDIFLDHAGFSTYESMYRARAVFAVKKLIIVTQKYHQYRALYNARGLGLTAYGVTARSRTYSGQKYREIREILARNKDFIQVILKPKPTYLGDVIPIIGSGIQTQ
jgi:SanA protein